MKLLYPVTLNSCLFLGTTGAVMMCAFFVDIIVWYKAGSINFVDEQTTAQDEELNPMTGKSKSETSV